LDASGYPVVSYYDSTNKDLKVARCNDPNCVGGDESTVTVDTDADSGRDNSLTLDPLGNPVVSYLSSFGGAVASLRVLHCADMLCSGTKPLDTDGDGCSDQREHLTSTGSERYGGLRDFTNPYDYFNPTHDGQNRVDDVLMVVQAFFDDDSDANPGLPPYAPGYNPDTDRTAGGPNVWNLGPGNGLQRLDDILAIIAQYFHDCS
jgi:hypothetical protein